MINEYIVVIRKPYELDTVIHESLLNIIIVCHKGTVCDRCVTNYEIDENETVSHS